MWTSQGVVILPTPGQDPRCCMDARKQQNECQLSCHLGGYRVGQNLQAILRQNTTKVVLGGCQICYSEAHYPEGP